MDTLESAVDRAIATIAELTAENERLRREARLAHHKGFEEGFKAANDHHDQTMALIEGALANR